MHVGVDRIDDADELVTHAPSAVILDRVGVDADRRLIGVGRRVEPLLIHIVGK